MSVQSEINRISGNVTAALSAIAQKGVTVGSGSNSDDLATLIAAIQKGVILPTLTNEGAAADLLTGKQLIDADGNIVNGGMTSVTQATPSISVSSGGLITASATQSAGKVAAGTKSATQQMTVQAAQTITPGTSNKTIASGRYLTGTQTIKGDANLLAENIKSGVSIFGVAGSLEVGSSGGSSGGDSGGSGTLETCTVTLSAPQTGSPMALVYSTLNNGEIECVQRYVLDFYIGMMFGTVVCLKNSFMVLGYPALTNGTKTPTVTGAIEIISDGKLANSVGAVFKISGDGSIAIA